MQAERIIEQKGDHFRESVPQEYRGETDPVFNDILKELAGKKQAAGLKDQSDYIQSKLPADKPKK